MPTASTKDISRIFRKLSAFTRPVVEVEPNIFVLNPLAVPTYGSPAMRRLNTELLRGQVKRAMRKLGFHSPVNMVFNPAAGLIAGKLGESTIIYYCVDEYTAFTGAARGLKGIEDDLFRRADIVVVSAERLREAKAELNPHTYLIRHGTDWNHFRTALDADTLVPADIRDLPRPIIGFHGLLADWVDYELIRKTAEHFSRGSVVLVGKVAVDAEKKIRVLDDAKNVHLLGRKPYAELPAYCRGFDAAINPFVINDLTLAANPLKVREYLAAGVPTVSTDIPEVRVIPNCRVGVDHDDFIRRLDEVLAEKTNRGAISESIREESWEAKVDELRRLIEQVNLTDA